MANYDDVIEKNKRYLTNAQVNALVAASKEYNIQNAGNRAGALASAREQYDTGYRGLQNMGLAGAVNAAPTSGEVPRLKTQLQVPFEDYNRRLREVENKRLNVLGGQMAESTRRVRAAAAAQQAALAAAAKQEAARLAAEKAQQDGMRRTAEEKMKPAMDAAAKAQYDGMKRTMQEKAPIYNAASKAQLDGMKRTAQTQQQLAQDQIALRAAAEVLGVKTVNQNAAAANAAQERGAALTRKLGGNTDTSNMNVYRNMTNQEKAEQTRLERAAQEDTGRGAIEARKALATFNKGLNAGFDKAETQKELAAAQKRVDDLATVRDTNIGSDEAYQQAVQRLNAAKLKAEDPAMYSFLIVANSNADAETKRLVGEKFMNEKFDDDAEDAALKYKSAQETVSRMEAEMNKGKAGGPSLDEVNDAIEVYNSAVAAYEDTASHGAPSAASREPINKANELLSSLGFKSIHAAERYRDSLTNTEEPEGLSQAREDLAAAELRYKEPDTYRAIRLLQYKDQLKQTNPDVVEWAEEKAADYQLKAMGIKTPGMATHDYRAEEADIKGLRKAYNRWKQSEGDAGEAAFEKELKDKYGVTPDQAKARLDQFDTEKDARLEYDYYKDGMVALLDHSGETPTLPVNRDETDQIYRKVNGLSNLTMAVSEYEGAESYNVANWMTQEQKDAYNAIYERDGVEAADQYFKDITPFLNIQRAMQDEAYYKQYADEHPFLADLRSIGANVLWNMPAAIDRLAHGVVGAYYDPNSELSYRSGRADVIRSERSQTILNNTSRADWVNNVLNFAYQTGMSMADSGTAMAFAYAGAPWMVDALFFSSAGNSAYKEAKERGATQAQAMEIGVLSGAAEAFFEHASIEHFMNMDYKGKGALVKNLVSQGFVEGSEEVATEIGNMLADAWVMRDKSKYAEAVKEYTRQGMTEEQAQNKAFMDQLADIGMAGFGGLVSGGLFGLGGAVVSSVQYNKEGKRLNANTQAKDRVIQLAEIMGGNAQEALDAYNADQTNRNLGELSATVQKNMEDMFGKEEAPDMSKATAMQKSAGAGNQMDLDAAVRDQIVDKATAYSALLTGDKMVAATAQVILDVLGKEQLKSMGYDVSSPMKLTSSYNKRLDQYGIQSRADTLASRTFQPIRGGYQSQLQQTPSAMGAVRAGSALTQTQQRTTEANVVRAENQAVDRVWENPEQGLAQIVNGRTITPMPGNLTAVSIAEQQRTNFKANATATTGRVTYAVAGMQAREGMSNEQTLSEIKKSLTKEARAKADFYEKLSKALGLKLTIHDVMVGTNGFIDENGMMHVVLSGKQSVLRVAAHELTHYMKENAAGHYAEMREYLIADVGQEKFDRMIKQKAREYGIDLSTEKGRTVADDEVCAELCERMLSDTDAIERFAEKNTAAAKTLKAHLVKILNAIKAALKDAKNRDFGQSWSDMVNDQDTIDKWITGLDAAIENAEKQAQSQTTQEQIATDTEADELYRSAEDIRAEKAKQAAEESAQKKTYVPGFKASEVERVLDAGVLGDKSNYDGGDYEKARGMIAQLIPDIVDGLEGKADLEEVHGKVQTAVGVMFNDYFEYSGDTADLRETIPDLIGVDATAKGDLKAQDQSLFQMSNKLSKALGKRVTLVSEQNAKGQKNAKYKIAEKLEDLWTRVQERYGLSDDMDFSIDTTRLLDFIEKRADTRRNAREVFGSSLQDEIDAVTGNIIDAVADMYSEKTGERFSLDIDYMRLAEKYKSGTATEAEMQQLQETVSQEAKRMGYDSPKLYHGTRSFGFTQFDLDKGEGYIFASSNHETAETYSGKTKRSKITDISRVDVDSLHGESLLKEAKRSLDEYNDFHLMTDKERRKENKLARDEISKIREKVVDFVHENDGAFDMQKKKIVASILVDIEALRDANTDDEMWDAWGKFDRDKWDLKFIDDSIAIELFDAMGSENLYKQAKRRNDLTYSGDLYANDYNGKIVFDNQIALELDAFLHKGIYSLYGKVGNSLEIDAKGDNWNQIQAPKELGLYGPETTRHIADAAFAKGYDSVVIKNLRDNGGETAYNATGDIYIFNAKNAVKSADPVTYDDMGDIIPLSLRFMTESPDIRYSLDLEELAEIDNGVRYSIDTKRGHRAAVEGDVQTKYKPAGRQPRVRDVQVPQYAKTGRPVSDFVRSFLESDKATDEMVADLQEKIENGDWGSYTRLTNKEAMATAQSFIANRTLAKAQEEFHDMVKSGRYNVQTRAIGLQLLAEAAQRGDSEAVLNIATDLRELATDAGQSVQIFNVLKGLGGVGSAWYMQKKIDALNAKYADRISSGKMNEITVSKDLMQDLMDAKTTAEVEAAEDEIAKEIARQLPLTWESRIANWRYLAMLGNPTTHFRNITGNVFMAGLNMTKDMVAASIERFAVRDTSKRAHALLTLKDRQTWGGFAESSYKDHEKALRGSGKFGFETQLRQYMRAFDTKWLNKLAQFNFDKLEQEDMKFIRPAYKNALMQYMKAQGYQLKDGVAGKMVDGKFKAITTEQMNAANEWASQQAWKATFHDASVVADMLNSASRKLGPVGNVLIEGVMPFKKTPINIAKRGIEYSPAGIIIGAVQLVKDVKTGKVTVADAIDNIASGITGTSLMALGAFLASMGVLRAGGEDKKKKETYLTDTGDQTYSLKIGKFSIGLSALAPATIPLFIGAALYDALDKNGEGLDLSAVTETAANALNPFMEMSFMSSLNSALKNYNNNGIGGALGNTLLTAAESYGSQFLPTAVAKAGQVFDPINRTTKSSAASPVGSGLDYYARSLAKKVPGLEATLQPDVDVWGRTNRTFDSFGKWALDFANKFIFPVNVKVANKDAVDDELIRVVESTGDVDILPSDGPKYFTVKGEKYPMTAAQYTEYSQERGTASYAALKETMSADAYQDSTDEEKAEMLSNALTAAQKHTDTVWKEKLGAIDPVKEEPEQPKTEVQATEGEYSDPALYKVAASYPNAYDRAAKAKAKGISPDTFLDLYEKKDTYSGDDLSSYTRQEIMNSNLTPQQKEFMDDLIVSDNGWNPDYSSNAWFEVSMLGTNSKDRQKHYEEAKEGAKIGLTPEVYVQAFNMFRSIDAKNENGKTVNGLKKKRAKEYLDSLPITAPVYQYIWTVMFNYK